MDDSGDFLSPEALRLLQESGIDWDTKLQPDELPLDDEPSTVLTQDDARAEHRKGQCLKRVPRGASLSMGQIGTSKRKRARFDPRARQKVATVRKRGACLRCRVLKLPCSDSWPCNSCTNNKVSCHGREPKNKWMACVSYSFKDFDIYSLDFPCSHERYQAILRTNANILNGNVTQTFQTEIHWDLGSLASDCADWILNERLEPGPTSRVWMFSSLKAQLLLSTFVDSNLSRAFRVLVETSSFLHNWGRDATYSQYSAAELWMIRSFAGSQVVNGLEHALKYTQLAKASTEALKALFLVLLGTIIAVVYSTPVCNSDLQLESACMTVNAFEEARKELILILTHHMVLIAERTHIIETQKTGERILENAHHLWSKKAVFKWEVVQSDNLEDFDASYSLTSPSDIVSPENSLERPISRVIGATGDLTFGRCFSCNNVLDANGLCLFCLDPALIDASAYHYDDCLQGPTLLQNQNSANVCSLGYVEEQRAFLDPLSSRLEIIGENCAPSSGPGWHDLFPSCSNLPCQPKPSNTSSFGMLGNDVSPADPTYGLPKFASPVGASADLGLVVRSLANDSRCEGNINSSKISTREVRSFKSRRRLLEGSFPTEHPAQNYCVEFLECSCSLGQDIPENLLV